MHKYFERQKLSNRKVSQLTGFHPNVRKTLAVFALSIRKLLKKAIAQLNICRENFCGSSKIRKTFLSLNFCCLR